MAKIEYVSGKWIERENTCRRFQYNDEPEMIHIIKTGFHNRYLLVWEDAYEVSLGKVEFHTAETLKEKYGLNMFDNIYPKGLLFPAWLDHVILEKILRIRKGAKLKALVMLKEHAKDAGKMKEGGLKWAKNFLDKFDELKGEQNDKTE